MNRRFEPNPFSLYDSDTEYADVKLIDYKQGMCDECNTNKQILVLKCTNTCQLCISCMRIIFKQKEDRREIMNQLKKFIK